MSLEKRLRALEEGVPKGYTTYDADGQPMIQTDLSAPEWYAAALKLLRSPGREKEKADLLWRLRASVGPDNSGGQLYEMLSSFFSGGLEPDELRKLCRAAAEQQGTAKRELSSATEQIMEGFVPCK